MNRYRSQFWEGFYAAARGAVAYGYRSAAWREGFDYYKTVRRAAHVF